MRLAVLALLIAAVAGSKCAHKEPASLYKEAAAKLLNVTVENIDRVVGDGSSEDGNGIK